MPVTTALAGNSERLHGGWQTAGVVFVADALGAWLVEQLADAGRKKLTELILGSEQERALRRAADAAVWATAEEMSPSGGEQPGRVAMVISEVFRDRVPIAQRAGPVMLLEGLRAGIAGQLAVLDDAELTGTGQSSADVLGLPGAVLADRLTGHLLREIIVRGSGGGALTPLADQLNHELTRLQIGGMLAQLATEVRDALARPDSGVTVAGRPLEEVTDPFVLEVHRPVQPEDASPGLPLLPPYVRREHDEVLSQVVRAAAGGRSGIAVLVGGSSVGKTRACWEVLALLRDQDPPWRLWHPINPSRPDAALRELPGIGPRTVVWLNEAQFYLDSAEAGLGERVAAGLRELLRNWAHGPVLVLATMWPQFWDDLTGRPADGTDRHAQARELLTGSDITVPAAFTEAQLRRLSQAEDTRLVQAAEGAQDGQVIQFLAGVPELMTRYRNAPPAAAALIHAAMDARRLGMGPALPGPFLEAAAPGYLAGIEWDALGEDWLEQALAYTAVPCKGVRGPLTRIGPHLPRSRKFGPGSQNSDAQLGGSLVDIADVPLYRLADYLDQHGRHQRKALLPPSSFWSVAAAHAFPGDQAALGDAADARGLYRAAAQLYKNAAASGNFDAVSYLAHPPSYLRPDVRPVRWAVAHVSLGNPGTVARLLAWPRETGAQERVRALLRRDLAAHVSLDDPEGVARLLDRLREAGAREQVTALADRAAAHAPLGDAGAVARLLDSLRQAGAQEQVTALLRRDPAAHASLRNSYAVARLLDRLREAGAREQVTALADRAAAHAPLGDAGAVARLLDSLRQAGAQEQVTALLRRDPAAHAPLDNSGAVARLLDSLREAGAREQVTALADRAAAHAPLDKPYAVADLLGVLHVVGSKQQVTALLRRDPAAHAALGDAGAVARLLDRLRQAGAQEQVTVLLRRDPAAHAALGDAGAVARLLDRLRWAGAQEQVTALADRAAAHIPLGNPGAVGDLLGSLRGALAYEQVTALLRRDPAAHASLDNPGAVARLMDRLRQAGAYEQVTALLRRDPAAHASLGDPEDVARLLDRLRQAGAQEQVTALADRAAAHAPLENPYAVVSLLDSLQQAGAYEQVTALLRRDPAAQASLDNSGAVARLLDRLRQAGAQEQVTALADRAAAHAPSKIHTPWSACWTAYGRRARTSRPPR